MDRNKIEREIEFHRKMANKMLAKYGGMVGDMKCIEHMNKADELEKKLNEGICSERPKE